MFSAKLLNFGDIFLGRRGVRRFQTVRHLFPVSLWRQHGFKLPIRYWSINKFLIFLLFFIVNIYYCNQLFISYMQLVKDRLYHYYNQGNNKEKIFFSRENYLFFLANFRKFVLPYCNVLCYCLMPNHFHFLINTTGESVNGNKIGRLIVPGLNNGFRLLLSSYTQAINKQEGRSGSLFRQKTKTKLLEDKEGYPLVCFHYIHQNPHKAKLVDKMEDWEFSSFRDYIGMRSGTLCDQRLAHELLGFSEETLYKESYQAIPEPEKISKLF